MIIFLDSKPLSSYKIYGCLLLYLNTIYHDKSFRDDSLEFLEI
jgi:hypothetical protein